ncbi:MAG: hypothetical protein II094_01280 [Oscillospiraceae bacterium]|nr:hypothetical protein [Oscillospiraceae bacterium]
MIVLKIIGVILLLLLLLSFLRIGAVVRFGDTLTAQLCAGPVKLTIYPKKAGKKKAEEKPKEEKPAEEKPKKEKKKPKLPKPTLEDIVDLLHTAFTALKKTLWRVCKRLRIDPLELTVIFGDRDPAGAAEKYGMANAVMWTFMPKLEELFYVPDPSLHLRMDYDAPSTRARGIIGVSLRICDLLAIIFTLLIPLGMWFLRFKKAHKGEGAPHKGKAGPGKAEPKDEKQEEKQANDLIA